MANTQNPYGFKPWGPVLSTKSLVKLVGAVATYKWDVVDYDASGGCLSAAAGSNVIAGSAAHYSAASTADRVLVFDDPEQKFECQDDGVSTLAQTNIGNLADHVATTGNTTTKISKHTLNSSTAATPAGWLILDLVQRQGNAFGAYGSMVVACNEHMQKYVYTNTTAGGRTTI